MPMVAMSGESQMLPQDSNVQRGPDPPASEAATTTSDASTAAALEACLVKSVSNEQPILSSDGLGNSVTGNGNATEADSGGPPPGAVAVAVAAATAETAGLEETHVPNISLFRLFVTFLWIGLRGFGGPVPQIAMMKQQFVIEGKWVTIAKFNRVLALYQAIPGPEATEMCCYFGLVARGRFGALLSGLAFLLPGFSAMLLMSYLYTLVGLDNVYVQASFKAIQPVVVAIMLKALHKLSEHAFIDHHTKQFAYRLGALGFLSTLMTQMRINFLITLVLAGLINFLAVRKGRAPKVAIALLLLVALTVYVLIVVYVGAPTTLSIGAGLVDGNTLGGLFVIGLLAGLLTFGGVYATIPFVQQDAVVNGGWMTDQQFLDGLAMTSMLPTSLVMFVVFVGYTSQGVLGAILMTLGTFLPAFCFVIFFHGLFERLIETDACAPILDGLMAATIGMVLVSMMRLLQAALGDPVGAAVFTMALFVLVHFPYRYTAPITIAFAAMLGQTLFATV